MALKENTKRIITFLQENTGKDYTADDVAEALGTTAKSVIGTFNMVIIRNKLGYRDEQTLEYEDGTTKVVKYLRLNDDGLAFDVNAEPAPKASDAE